MDKKRLSRFLCILYLVVIGLSQTVSAQDTFQCNYTTDIDQDNDGLIELCDLNALDAIRYQLDGSGYRESFDAVKITAGCPQRGCNGYELRGDLDFNAPGSYRNVTDKAAWTSGLGWLPLGNQPNPFNARFEGNGHTIANLYINRPSDYVGLFRATAKLAKVSDLVLSQINIKGNSYVGSLAGHNAGSITYIGVEGGRLVGMSNNVGGLFGTNIGTIINGDVMLERIEGTGHSLGGLVGHNQGHVTYSVADTDLSGVNQVGGMVGLNFDGVLTDSRAAGTVKGRDYVGGLVGLNRAQVGASDAEAEVISEGSYSGGLVGANHQGGRIVDSQASGTVSGNLYVGGLVGWNRDSEISNSFAVSRTGGNSDVGGLVGSNERGQISNTYASGSVTGVRRVGGLVGSNQGIVSDSFANRRVIASGEHLGGLIGWNYANQTRDAATVRVIHSYWDSEASRILISAGGSPRTTTQLKSPTAPGLLGETFERWDTDDWEFGTSEQYPILRHSEGSNQGYLLPDQHIMLSGLLVLDGLTLSPAFNPQTFDYRVNLSDDGVSEIRLSPTIANSTQTISVLKDEEVSLPSINNGEAVSINLNVAPEPTLITVARHYRIWVIRQSGLDATISSDRPDYRLNEGQSITLNISTSEPDLRRVRYRWHQVLPTQPDLLKDSDTNLAELSIGIPDDLVAQDADETSVVLQVEVRANGITLVRNTTMTIVKANNGSLDTLAAPVYDNATLTVADISEADFSVETDGGVDLSSFRHQWQYRLPSESAIWQDIEDATETRYEIPQVLSAVDNISYRVWLDYQDNQGHDHRVVSPPLSVVNAGQEDGFSDIYYLEDLAAIRNQLNAKYELVRDLDFNLDASYRNPINKEKWTVADYRDNADAGWLSIGTFENSFTGMFKGNGYTIFNLQINRDSADNQGLFGALGSGAMVSNVGIANAKIEGKQFIGGLAGFNEGTIVGSHAIGEVSASGFTGGLVGLNGGKIINSHASVIASGTNQHTGGLVGRNFGLIISSYASGDIRGSINVGGLTGSNGGSISNSYATGSVEGNFAGGLVGFNQGRAAITGNSYAIGRVQGSGGGLVASNSGAISMSYWNTETSGLQGRHGIGQTTQRMQLPIMAIGIYEAWDDDDWDFGNSEQYPILKYAPGPDGDGCGSLGLPQCGELISPHLRYGLRNLVTAGGVALSPKFNAARQNQSGIYIGSLRSANNTIRLIPTTIESTAYISFYVGDDETAYDRIRSGETSKAVSLKKNDVTRIHVEVQGTQTVRYTLYIDYLSTVTPGEFTIASVDIITINYLEDLQAIRNRLTGSYRLARDLDFADHKSYLHPFNRISWTVDDYDDASDMGWVPIGSETKPFAGSFDGNGYTISGLQINRDNAENQSLFGVTSSDALISNIGLLHVKVEGGAKVAGLVGTNRGQVGYSYVSGSIASKPGNIAGGLVAINAGGNIIGSYAISKVSGVSSIGGLVGDNHGTIINSHADSVVLTSASGGSGFGGLVGYNRSLIANSYATGRLLTNNNSIIGGLVGQNDSRVVNGYASVSIEGAVAGGLIGYNTGSIKNSYAIGELKQGNRTKGSLVGISEGVDRIAASYWNTDNIATGPNNGSGQNTLQLQSGISQSSDASRTYYKWSDSDWHFGDMDQYPILKHTPAAESVFGCGSLTVLRCGDLISPGLRYGLRDLKLTSDAGFTPLVAIEKLNQSGVYVGTVFGEHSSVRLIPVAMESTARISIIGTKRQTIDSHDISSPISLKNDGINKIVVEVEGTKTVRYTLYLNHFQHRVIDEDNDGLVDINYLEDLDAIRYQLDGSGYRADDKSLKVTSGCPSEGCRGYELLRDLDFNDSGSYRDADANMGRWTSSDTWQPIAGTLGGSFIGMFKGNNKTIANLRVRRSGGLFATIGSDDRVAHVDGIGLLGVDIKANTVAGIASSCKQCTISNSYVIGDMEGTASASGLVGTISMSRGIARISNSYFIGNLVVNGRSAVSGGLIGDVDSDISITDSYAVGRITAEHDDGFIGSLIGVRSSSNIQISNSYTSVLATEAGEEQGLFGGNRNSENPLTPIATESYIDQDISGTNVTLGRSLPTDELQSPTSATGIYMRWGSDNLGNSDNWDFGTDKQYPVIKYNLRADFTTADAHCATADMQKRPAACRTLLRHQGGLLQDLKLSEGAGLSHPFIFASFDYRMSVNADHSTIRLLPTAFNAIAVMEVFKDGNLVGASDSGEWTVPIPLNDDGDTVVSLVVKEGNRRSYRYQFIVSRLDIVAEDIDKDGDGLIDINDATHLSAIRHRLDGSAYQQSVAGDVIYCSNGCVGYELTADIDLAEVDWQPIGSLSEPFTSILKGNGHTISNLTLDAIANNNVGLFAAIGKRGRVENVGVVNVNIVGNSDVGSIAGYNSGTIINTYASGRLSAAGNNGGGLVGRNEQGTIANSYANVGIDANGLAGGLVGWSQPGGLIVNSYAFGDVQIDSGDAGGLVGSNSARIDSSYATGNVLADNGNAGGLVASTSLGHAIVNSYHRTGAVISGTDSLVGTVKTVEELWSGVPSDDIYTGWDRADWNFGGAARYPALLYAADNGNNATCTQPSPQQLSACNDGLFADLSEHDKKAVCLSHLPRLPEQKPYCGALLPEQRIGLVQLEFAENAYLLPAFKPEIYEYDLIVDSSIEILRSTPTSYYGSDTITVDADSLISATGSGQGLSFTLSDDLDSIVFEVQSATQGVPPYTINVLQDIAIADGFIMIDYLEDLNLMRHSLAQVSAPFKDCPIDTQSNMRRCKGYKLARDLDFKDPTSYRAGDINPMWTDGAGWQPIGSFSNPFRDLFSGNAHTISHLSIYAVPASGIGLFGYLADSARIENIGLLTVDIDIINSSRLNTSALVGWNRGEIVNSYVIGGAVKGFNSVGGLVGTNAGYIVNSYTNVSVSGLNSVGGLVGFLGSDAEVGFIHNSYASGMVVGSGEGSIGGLIGSALRPNIHNSYASGMVVGSSEAAIGGLIGQLSANNLSILNNSYATGELTGRLFRGGLIGLVSGGLSGAINASYWDVDTSKASGSAGGVGKMTAELQTPAIGDGIYEDWDSSDWYSMVDQYPVLRYTSATDVLTRPACSAAEDIASEMPICGTLLPAQRISGLQSLARSNSIGQVLLLRPDFNPGIYDYELILRSDARLFSIIPNTFNRNARIVITDDSGTNERKTLRTGQTTSLFMDNINNFLMTLTVEDPPLLGTTITTIYRFAVSKHPLIAVNDIDEDDDGLIEIYHIEDLNTMRYQLDGSGYRVSQDDTKIIEGCLDALCFGYELTRDLDFGDATSYRTGVVNSEWATNWQPIGDQGNPFNGVFDGNNHTISNLRIDRTNTDSVGLFVALADGAQVRNVNLEDVAVKGRFDVGSLAAYNAGEIDNSHADGTVIGERAVGGLAAHNIGSIFNSSAYGVVSGDPKNEVALVGGLVSRNENTGVIANSYSLSRVSGRNNIGGLVGLNLGSIANTYASGSIQGVTLIGGLVGENGGLISDSYATASIVCTGVPACASYAVASGGLIGSNANGGIAINSYWDIETSNIQDNIQGWAAGSGKTTLQLQSGNSQSSDASGAYYQWRNSDWSFGDAYQYPILKYTDSTENMLSGLQSYGLRNLAIVEVVRLSPNFSATRLYYRIGVDLDANIRHLHLIPRALDNDAIIRVASNSGFDETVASGTSSSAITLLSTTTTMISIEVLGERNVRYRFDIDYFSSGSERDIDTDEDGLIEILTLEDLDAMRNALDGRRLRHQNGDGVLIESARGCPITGCIGYELLQDLDFDNPAHYRAGRVNTAWTSGAGWQPIGTSLYPFTATFRGNGYTISNLTVNRLDSDGGLFGMIDSSEANATIEGLGLIDVDIVGGAHAGGLVGYNRAGNISKSYVTGSVAARGNGISSIVGGLVGRNEGGIITASYALAQVRTSLSNKLPTVLAGGLVALNDNRARIENSYAVGSVIGLGSVGGLVALHRGSSKIINSYAVSRAIAIGAMSQVGGLVARNDAMVGDSYWDIEASGVALSAAGTSATTAILQTSTPTSPINSIYRNWGADVWEFADANRYPTLKAINNASLLILEGKGLLQSLTVSDTARLFPSFHPLIFDYELIAESGQMTEVQINTTATRVSTAIDVSCSDGLVCSSGLPLSFALDGSHIPQITITTTNPDAGELSYHFSVRYARSEIRQVSETTTTTVSLPLTVTEGDRVRLTAFYNIGLNEDSYRYRWWQAEGDTLKLNDSLPPVDTQNAVLDFTLPFDVVLEQNDSRTVQLIIEIAVNADVYLNRAIPLVVLKRNNDTADRVRLIRSGRRLVFYEVQLEREDGGEFVDRDGGMDSNSLDFQWQRRRNDSDAWVNSGKGFLYPIPKHGTYQYRVLATYEDNQGYRQQLASDAINYLDIDSDGDGLIEIRYLEELNEIRYQLDGSGYKANVSAKKVTVGCPLVNREEKCRGYELMNDLDFAVDASYRTSNQATRTTLKNIWTVGDFKNRGDFGWQPIGDPDNPFNAVFDGNGYTISNMQINRSVGNLNSIGLFSELSSTAKIENLGLINPVIKGLVGIKNVGGIAGAIVRGSEIINSYVIGDVASGNIDKIIRGDVGFDNGRGLIGGLVGWNKGLILNSHAKINVVAEDSGTFSNKQVRVGGLVGRNIDGGKVYNSYATGEVKGPCLVGGLVGNQFSTDSAELLKRSEIKNSYATGNVETGFGACSNPNIKIAGGLVGINNNSRIENSYAIGKVSGDGGLSGLVGSLLSATSIANIVNSYWDTETSEIQISAGGVGKTTSQLQSGSSQSSDESKAYYQWRNSDWNFGTDKQYPTLKYGVGLDTNNPGCDEDPETELSSCDSPLSGQIADALLLNSLNLSANSKEVQLTPGFDPNRLNYKATIKAETLPIVIKVAADADAGTAITIRKDGGAALTKQSDGTVQMSVSKSFNLGIETARGNNREANYQIQIRLEHPPEANIFRQINASTPTELTTRDISTLDEGDTIRFDASTSFGHNNLPLDYQWSQVSGKPLLLKVQATSTLELTVATDFLSTNEDESTVILELELSEQDNPASVASTEILLLIRKVNNGNSEGAAKWINSDTLFAGDLSEDIDGRPVADIDYQWLFEEDDRFGEISGANQRSFTPQKGFRNKQYRLSMSYVDAQGYETNLHYDAPLYANIAMHKDKDNDGLIEIETLEDLNAIHYQLDGSGYRASSTATSKITAGCPLVNDVEKCRGYELVRDLDFLDDASYSSISNKQTWTTGSGWRPIGFVGNTCLSFSEGCFNSTFEGNGYVISNLRINISRGNYLGLFSENQGIIRNLGLLKIKVTGAAGVGGLAGRNFGNLINVYVNASKVRGSSSTGLLTGISATNSLILNSYAHGDVSGTDRIGGICGNNLGNIRNSYTVVNVSAATNAGGLVGNSGGSIINSYATGSVSISDRGGHAGGIVGLLSDPGSISNSYSTAEVKVTFEIQNNNDVQYIGGLIGRDESSMPQVNNSYWDIDASKQVNSSGGGTSKTQVELQMPTAPGATANDIYHTWSPDRWDFGTSEEYPALKYPNNNCGTSTLSPDCSKLLLNQRIGLRDLNLEQNMGAGHLHLSPDFDPAVTTYTVSVHADASELKITPIATNPDAVIVADGKVLSASDAGYTIALNTSDPTSTVISVAASNSMGTEKPVIYKLTINNNRFPRISINAPASIVEGETFMLDAVIEDLEGDELSYSLTTTPDLLPNLGISTGTVIGRTDLRYQTNIPRDLLAEMQSTDAVEIVLTADDGLNVVSEMAQLTIVKANNSVILIPAPTLNDFTYIIENIDLSLDADGTNPAPEIAYQWQRELLGRWSNIDDAVGASYTAEGIIGDRYRVLVDYTDKQGYRHRDLVSPAVSAPQQFVYNVVRSRDVVRTMMDRSTGIFINIRVLLEGLLP